eukprot:SAG25_NODE_12455_length_280_cov_0.569061_1_plen_69_part_01
MGRYVSNLGRYQDSLGRVHTPRPSADETYARVGMRIGGVNVTFLFHRLVLAAFAGECPDGCSGGATDLS